jgi:UDP-glucose 4-epimerase
VRVLITGICGFVGSHLADAFTADGHEVVGIDTLATGREQNWPVYKHIDICDRRRVYELANDFGPTLVIHCAASYKDPAMWHADTRTNVEGAINVAAVARYHQAPIVYFQTVLPPISSYAISKLAGEHYLRLSGQPLTVYRLAAVYGPRNLSGPIPTFYKRIKATETCAVTQGASRDFVYVDDLVYWVLDGVENETTGTFDIATGDELLIEELCWLVGEEMGVRPHIEMRPRSEDDVASYDMNPSPWSSAKTPMWLGLRATIAWYEAHGVEQTYTHLAMK